MKLTLSRFLEIPGKMVYKEAARRQIEQVEQFAEALDLPWDVAGQHVSKSIPLPVIRITCMGMVIYLRDNFYDINICVVAVKPITTPVSVLFDDVLQPLPWDWYLGEVARARGYSWREWTDEQMDTPGLLALANDVPSHMVRRYEEKVRWSKRMTDPEWFDHDWSRTKLVWDGEFGPGVTMYAQERAFMQGISELVPSSADKPYEPGCTGFALALSELGQAKALILNLTRGSE